MPKKGKSKGRKGGKKLSEADRKKKAENKARRSAERKNRAEKRKAARALANDAYATWGKGHLFNLVQRIDTFKEKILKEPTADDYPNPRQLDEFAAELDNEMVRAMKQFAERKGIDVNNVSIAADSMKVPEEQHLKPKKIARWLGHAKRNALLVEQFNSHANRKNPNPSKPTKDGYVESRHDRSPEEQAWLTLQDAACKGLHRKRNRAAATPGKVETAKEELAKTTTEGRKFGRRQIPNSASPFSPVMPQVSLSARMAQYPSFNLG